MKFIVRVLCLTNLDNDEECKTYLKSKGLRYDDNAYYDIDESDPTLEINSLKELMKFQKKVKYPIIMTGNIIEIYNGYRE